jgi:hypothetical protein
LINNELVKAVTVYFDKLLHHLLEGKPSVRAANLWADLKLAPPEYKTEVPTITPM